MTDSGYEIVHTITNWYDGARGGVADLNGKPHYYECQFDDATDDWSAIYFLEPLDRETLVLALEDWQIWLRWNSAFKEHKATIETHPALPADRERHDELSRLLADSLVIGSGHIKATGDFKYGEPTLVKWTVVP